MRTSPARRVRRRAERIPCPWCYDPFTSASVTVVADGCVWHAKCWDGQAGEGLCAECGDLLGENLHPERTPSCRCATIVYDEDGYPRWGALTKDP